MDDVLADLLAEVTTHLTARHWFYAREALEDYIVLSELWDRVESRVNAYRP